MECWVGKAGGRKNLALKCSLERSRLDRVSDDSLTTQLAIRKLTAGIMSSHTVPKKMLECAPRGKEKVKFGTSSDV